MILTVTGDLTDVFRITDVRLAPIFIVYLKNAMISAAVETTLVVRPCIEPALPVSQTQP